MQLQERIRITTLLTGLDAAIGIATACREPQRAQRGLDRRLFHGAQRVPLTETVADAEELRPAHAPQRTVRVDGLQRALLTLALRRPFLILERALGADSLSHVLDDVARTAALVAIDDGHVHLRALSLAL
ncbi:hypothetical protein D3C86_1329240 [compost metagenome]